MRHSSWLSYKYCCLTWLLALLGLLFNSKKPKHCLGDLANMLQPTHNHPSLHLPAEMLATSSGFPKARLQPTDGRVQGNALCPSSKYQCSELMEHFQPPRCSLGPHDSLDKTPESIQTEVWQADCCGLRSVHKHIVVVFLKVKMIPKSLKIWIHQKQSSRTDSFVNNCPSAAALSSIWVAQRNGGRCSTPPCCCPSWGRF